MELLFQTFRHLFLKAHWTETIQYFLVEKIVLSFRLFCRRQPRMELGPEVQSEMEEKARQLDTTQKLNRLNKSE